MRKFKINRTKKELNPSDEQIKRHKDFKRLSHEYDQIVKRPIKPLYQNPRMFLYIIIIGIILYLIFSKN